MQLEFKLLQSRARSGNKCRIETAKNEAAAAAAAAAIKTGS